MKHFFTVGRLFTLQLLLAISFSAISRAESLQFYPLNPSQNSEQPISAQLSVGCQKIQDDQKTIVDISQCLQDFELQKTFKVHWKMDETRSKAIGCETVTESLRPPARLAEEPLSKCLSELPYTLHWTLNANEEIEGCKGVAQYRGLEIEITDFDFCYQKIGKLQNRSLIYDIVKKQSTGECAVFSEGKTFAVPRYRRQKCSLLVDLPIQVTLVGRGSEITENIEFAWIESKGQNCSAVSDKSFQILGSMPNEKCQEVILKQNHGKSELVGPVKRNRVYTFRKLLLDDKLNTHMKAELGPNCTKVINAITHSGGSLFSRTLANAIVPLNSIRFFSGVQDNRFYHWTTSPGLFTLFKLDELTSDQASERALKENDYEKIFYYLRTRSADQFAFWRRVFYVAEDTQSSSFLGNKLVEFTLNPKANTIFYHLPTWKAAMAEVSAKYPELNKNCRMNLDWAINDTFGGVMFANLFFIVAEDSGVSVVDFNQGGRWFQILSSEPFVSVRKVQ